nr:unnamed protein product [Callosobruchus chinensis]
MMSNSVVGFIMTDILLSAMYYSQEVEAKYVQHEHGSNFHILSNPKQSTPFAFTAHYAGQCLINSESKYTIVIVISSLNTLTTSSGNVRSCEIFMWSMPNSVPPRACLMMCVAAFESLGFISSPSFLWSSISLISLSFMFFLGSFRGLRSQDTASDIISGCSQSSSSTPTTPSFKRPRNKADQLLDKIAKRMEHPVIEIPSTRCSADKLRQPHEAFGEYIADKLRSIPPPMVPYCQKLINDAVFFAELEKLNDSMARPCVTPIIWTLAEWTRPKCPGPNGSAVSGGL